MTSTAVPPLGTIVHYQLNDGDVAWIDRGVDTAALATVRNPVRAGQTYPAQVVSGHGPSVNLVVQLDGTVQYWATSRVEGTAPGTWSRMAKAPLTIGELSAVIKD